MFGKKRSAVLSTLIGCLALGLMVFLGCADIGNITGPEDQTEAVDHPRHDQPTDPMHAANHPRWLHYSPVEGEGLAKTVRGGTYVEGLFKPGKKLTLKLGDKSTIEMELELDGKALSEETLISMSLPEPGTVSAIFAPHGTVFLEPAEWTIKIPSDLIDLADDEVVDLQCYYWNEDTGEWQAIGGEAELHRKLLVLTCYLDHFSRYAWASAR